MNNNIDENTIIEINNEFIDTLYEEKPPVVPEKKQEEVPIKKPKKRLKKKALIIIVVVLVALIALVFGLLFYFGVFGKSDNDITPVVDDFVVEDNYKYENGALKFINKSSEEIGTYDCTNKNASKCYVKKLSNTDDNNLSKYINKDGSLYDKTSKIYYDRYVFINDGDESFLYDIRKKEKKESVKEIKTGLTSKDLVVIKNSEDKYELLLFENDKYTKVLNDSYEYLAVLTSDDKYLIKEGDNYFIIDNKGEKISTGFNKTIKAFNDKYVATSDNTYNLYDFEGNSILNNKEFINLDANYVYVVNSKALSLFNNDLNKINEIPIKLRNTDYIKKYVVSEDGTLDKTQKSYDIIEENNKLAIEVTSGEEVEKYFYDLNYFALSNNESYIRYEKVLTENTDGNSSEAGALYFYEDDKKNILIGKYECQSLNDDGFNNCFIAEDAKGSAFEPIINKRFVFIKDKNIINLYDITGKKVLSKYLEVTSDIAMGSINHITSYDNLFTCKNTDENYGVITINDSGASGIIPFKISSSGKADYTKEITLKDDLFYVKRTTKNYVYDKKGVELASSVFEINDYLDKYYVVKDDTLYVVSPSGQMISDQFKYIKLYNGFFAGVNEKMLNIYKYADAKTKVLSDDIELLMEKTNDAFSIETSTSGYTINIFTYDGFTSKKYDLNWQEVTQ